MTVSLVKDSANGMVVVITVIVDVVVAVTAFFKDNANGMDVVVVIAILDDDV